ncbi:hypothetical protein YQE_00033, partial [Dendroctonus ponderosae]
SSSFELTRHYSLYSWIKVIILSLALTSLFLHVICSSIQWEQPEKPAQNWQESELSEKPAEELQSRELDVDGIQMKMQQANDAQVIFNEESFESLHNESLVIVVQVHNRLEYLGRLIESLSKAKHIEDTLLVFSHDVFNEEINELVRRIPFCKVMQIFFPYSLQTHRDRFPGTDPRDCPRDLKKSAQVRTLQRSEIYANQAPLVVEVEPPFSACEGHQQLRRLSGSTGGGPLCDGGFCPYVETDGRPLQEHCAMPLLGLRNCEAFGPS